MKGLASRKLAAEILLKIEQKGAFAGPALTAAFNEHALPERDRAFVTCIVQGTMRHLNELDETIKSFSKIPLPRLAPSLRAILRSAFFQILYLEDMPAFAVINIAVETARKTGHEGQAKYVNAVLRSFLRSRESEPTGKKIEPGRDPSAEGQDTVDVPVPASTSSAILEEHSLPEWIVSRWKKRFDTQEVSRLLASAQEIPLLILRTCELSITPEGLREILRSKGMTVEHSALVPSCLKIIDRGRLSGPVNKIPGYTDGLFAVQDDVSALVSIVLSPQPGQFVIDLCAAPGGKTVHMGELMQNKGRVVAVDISNKRLSLLAGERRRLGLTNIETAVADAGAFQPDSPCDAVLVDAPCSGTGVLNRRPDLRQHRQEGHIGDLVEIQKALLDNAAKMLKPGGVLVYSTCSIETEENADNLKWFLETHPEYSSESLMPFFNSEILASWSTESHFPETQKQLQNGFIQLLPSRHGCSGFFISRFRRRS